MKWLAYGAGSLLALVVACGSRTTLVGGGNADADAGSDPPDVEPPPPECALPADCEPLAANVCGSVACEAGKCVRRESFDCDDGDPCTTDRCFEQRCTTQSTRVDADGDGYFAMGTENAVGCGGDDCDDTNVAIHPNAGDTCNSLDDDCDGAIDEDASLVRAGSSTRISSEQFQRANAGVLAFDGANYGVTFTGTSGTRTAGYLRRFASDGTPLAVEQPVTRVNVESFGGPLVWSGSEFLTAWDDARQSGNYEIYFTRFDSVATRLMDDARVTDSFGFSVHPALVLNGAEPLVIWDDRRAGTGAEVALFGQRLSAQGALLGKNVQLTPTGMQAEYPSAALLGNQLGVAFTSLRGPDVSLMFAVNTIGLDAPPLALPLGFANPCDPRVITLGDTFVVTFEECTDTPGSAIWGVVVSPEGKVLRGPQPLTSGMGHARSHSTYSLGDRFVLVWSSDVDGDYDLYFEEVDAQLAGRDARAIIQNPSDSLAPSIAPGPSGNLGIAYTDWASGSQQVYFTRLTCVSALL